MNTTWFQPMPAFWNFTSVVPSTQGGEVELTEVYVAVAMTQGYRYEPPVEPTHRLSPEPS